MFSHSGKPKGIVITTVHLNIQLDGKLREIWPVDYQQNH